MKYKVIKNFLPKEDLFKLPLSKGFRLFKSTWFDFPFELNYHNFIIEEAKSFVNLDNIVGLEQWHHNPHFMPLPGEHYDKNEYLYATEEKLEFPLCSCILYMKIEDLVGSNLLIENEIELVPETNTLILMKPGVLHAVTDFTSGTRTSLNINPWDKKLI